MSSRLLTRTLVRQHALGTGLGLAVGAGMVMYRPPKLRMDYSRAAPRPASTRPPPKERLDPEMMKQLSSGSIAGFVSGLVISIFSRTLVLLLGLTIVVLQMASRYGIDIVRQLQVKQRVGNSRILTALEKNPAFKLSFGLFFAMSAFMQL
ncbi:hypothetical protein F4779DRAFT_613223 [Xylariaceae sp. FL0662B]|nr:hypothetical protein F4779DRAFT_613223 [Xylariaceae sp. FL0662B]